MPDQTKFYVIGAFFLGAVLTVAYNKHGSNSREHFEHAPSEVQRRKLLSRLAKDDEFELLKTTLGAKELSLEKRAGSIKEGIEGCIGNTPLIKIKSLSEYTGCEILAKAEVSLR